MREVEKVQKIRNSANERVKYSVEQHNTIQYSTAQHSTAQHSTAQHSIAQENVVQYMPGPQFVPVSAVLTAVSTRPSLPPIVWKKNSVAVSPTIVFRLEGIFWE